MNKFAFIIHPIEVADIYRKFPLLERFPVNLVEKTFKYLPPMKVSVIEGVRSPWGEVQGFFIACPLTTRQLLTLPEEVSIKKIIEAVKVAEKLGAQIVGLGAMTSVVGDAGITIAKNSNIPVTTGNSYTVASALDATLKAAALMDIDISNASVAVLGATGSVGSVMARLIARKCKSLMLVARNSEKLNKLARIVMYESGIALEVSCESKEVLRKADIIISVTASMDTVINPEDLKPGAVVCDVARPRDVSLAVQKLRRDVLVIEGGVIKVPGPVEFNFNFGFPPGLAYACMAETMILALESKWECFSLGRELSIEGVEEIKALATKHNFQLAGMRSFEKTLTNEHISRIKNEVIMKREKEYTIVASG
ncbi:MAG: shikimate dehydrogenase [Peptococcaceae bacterium BICA1-8]|nr:MAG: shikimate dehydrogenase [Peptococcaceae bacterium BICA1-8]